MPRRVRAILTGFRGLGTRGAPLRLGLLLLTSFFAISSVGHAQQGILSDPAPPSDEPLFSWDSPLGKIDYVTARGLRLGRTGLNVGGFTTLEIDKEEGEPGVVELDALNFLVLWEPVDFLRGFAEIEIGNLLSIDMETGDVDSNADVTIERLYGDLSRNDALNARIGKFQTPVGIWNLVPAEPFTWTATEPILTESAFDEHQTGGAIFGSVYPASKTLDYWIYGQFLDPLHPSDDPEPVDRSVGGRLRYEGALGRWAVGTSFLASEQDGEWNFLGGLDAFGRIGPLELQGEVAIVQGDIPHRDLWGVYVQGVYDLEHASRFLRNLHLVARYEHFHPLDEGRVSNLWNVGLAWMPARFVIIKAGYQFADHRSELVSRGLFSSFSVLF